MKVRIKLSEGGILPKKGEPNAMCYDCYAMAITHRPDGKVEVDLGFSATPPIGYGIRLIPRSSLSKYWWCMNNSIGVGDMDFKNNYKAIFTPIPKYERTFTSGYYNIENFPYELGHRCCQMEIYERKDFEFEQVEELTGNDRGGGFGSTGVK